MTDIKFRAKSKATNSWVYGFYAFVDGQHYIIQGAMFYTAHDNGTSLSFNDWDEVKGETVSQWTGLKDQRLAPIFYGDILNNEESNNVEVWYDDGATLVGRKDSFDEYLYQITASKLFIIGNVQDNSDLLT